jgi:hypothetical protein
MLMLTSVEFGRLFMLFAAVQIMPPRPFASAVRVHTCGKGRKGRGGPWRRRLGRAPFMVRQMRSIYTA